MSSEVTIIVVPRDHFYHARASLKNVIECTEYPYEMIYVDHSSPRDLQNFLEVASDQYGFRLLRSPVSLSPNQARNLAIAEVKNPFIVFIDNDLFVTPGWLENLVVSAKENDALIVSPTYLIGELEKEKIHIAGGKIEFTEDDGDRRFHETHLFLDRPLGEVKDQLKPGATDFGEFHCLLVRTEVFQKLGLLDESLLSQGEHLDLCMRVKQSDGLIYYEPESIVTYLIPKEICREDIPYFLLRWSDDWNRRSIEHFCSKWGIEKDDPYRVHQLEFLTFMRRRVLSKVFWPWGRILEVLLYRRIPVIDNLIPSIVHSVELSAMGDIASRPLDTK